VGHESPGVILLFVLESNLGFHGHCGVIEINKSSDGVVALGLNTGSTHGNIFDFHATIAGCFHPSTMLKTAVIKVSDGSDFRLNTS
jgi:hypothetical protein